MTLNRTWHNKSVNRSWLAFRFFNIVSFVYVFSVCQRQLHWSANPVNSDVPRISYSATKFTRAAGNARPLTRVGHIVREQLVPLSADDRCCQIDRTTEHFSIPGLEVACAHRTNRPESVTASSELTEVIATEAN